MSPKGSTLDSLFEELGEAEEVRKAGEIKRKIYEAQQKIEWITFDGYWNADQTVDWDYPVEPDTSEAERAQFGESCNDLMNKRIYGSPRMTEIRDWREKTLPEWHEYMRQQDEYHAKYKAFDEITFVGQDLNKPGTLVELQSPGGESWIAFLGDVNPYLTGGDFFHDRKLRVLRYAYIFDLDEIRPRI